MDPAMAADERQVSEACRLAAKVLMISLVCSTSSAGASFAPLFFFIRRAIAVAAAAAATPRPKTCQLGDDLMASQASTGPISEFFTLKTAVFRLTDPLSIEKYLFC